MHPQTDNLNKDSNINNDSNASNSATNQRCEVSSQDDNNLEKIDGIIKHGDDVILQMDDNNKDCSSSKNEHNAKTETTTNVQNDENGNNNLDNSNNSTAFTITFEGEDVGTKKFGIRDSIRKFAPPKSFTKLAKKKGSEANDYDNEDCIVDSGSASLPFNGTSPINSSSSNFNRSNKARSSHNSKFSNVDDSANYLIDKMLNLRQISKDSSMNRVSDANQLDPMDNCDAKSDNGTYIVGEEDQELQADREKIDELFGVVKKAEQSVVADFTGQRNIGRQSRELSNKKALSRERQDHINRLAQLPLRSTSSTRQDTTAPVNPNHKSRDKNRRSRNSSCERTTISKEQRQHPKRSISQSSKQSHRSYVESDSQSGSRNSLNQATNESSCQSLIIEQQLNVTSTPATTKYNRTFALRRARLGLGEPVRIADLQQDQLKSPTQLSPRKAQNQPSQQTALNKTNNGNFSRADGGRFSLRTKNFVTPTRVLSAVHRSHQQSSNLSRIERDSRYKPTLGNPESDIDYNSVQQNDLMDDTAYISARLSGQCNVNNNTTQMASSFYKRIPSDLHQSTLNDMSYYYQQQQQHQMSPSTYAEPTSLGGHERYMLHNRTESSLSRLGALDNLVISAISSLSVKLRESVCDLLVHHAKRLPVDDDTRSIVEEILPQLSADMIATDRSPTSIDEIDNSSHFELSKTLRNLKKVEQMVGVIGQISSQLSNTDRSSSPHSVTARLSHRSPTSSVKSSNNSNRSDANLSINSDYNNPGQK